MRRDAPRARRTVREILIIQDRNDRPIELQREERRANHARQIRDLMRDSFRTREIQLAKSSVPRYRDPDFLVLASNYLRTLSQNSTAHNGIMMHNLCEVVSDAISPNHAGITATPAEMEFLKDIFLLMSPEDVKNIRADYDRATLFSNVQNNCLKYGTVLALGAIVVLLSILALASGSVIAIGVLPIVLPLLYINIALSLGLIIAAAVLKIVHHIVHEDDLVEILENRNNQIRNNPETERLNPISNIIGTDQNLPSLFINNHTAQHPIARNTTDLPPRGHYPVLPPLYTQRAREITHNPSPPLTPNAPPYSAREENSTHIVSPSQPSAPPYSAREESNTHIVSPSQPSAPPYSAREEDVDSSPVWREVPPPYTQQDESNRNNFISQTQLSPEPAREARGSDSRTIVNIGNIAESSFSIGRGDTSSRERNRTRNRSRSSSRNRGRSGGRIGSEGKSGSGASSSANSTNPNSSNQPPSR